MFVDQLFARLFPRGENIGVVQVVEADLCA